MSALSDEFQAERPMRICSDCGEILTDGERELLTGRCYECALSWQRRLELWQLGAADEELDALYLCQLEFNQRSGTA